MNQNNLKLYIQQALASINQNHLEEAHKLLLHANKISPENIEVYHLLSVVYGMSEDYETSELYCKKALAINNNAVIIYNNLGTAQKLQGKYEDARNSFVSAIGIRKDYIDPYVNLANLYLEIEAIDEAESLINTAMNIDSSNLTLNLALGNLRLKQDNHKDAIDIYENILFSQPGVTDAIINLGQIYEHLGDMNKALKHYSDALSIIPNYDQSVIGIASILEKRGQYEDALKIIKPAIQYSKNIKLHIILGRIYSRLKDYSKAEEILLNAKDMLAIDQHKQELLYELGDARDKQAHYDEAFSAYQQANQINKLEFNRKDAIKLFDDIKSVYTAENLKNISSSNNQAITPIFIVGMPRSGTSLVEQIIASHSQVHGAGELEYIDEIIFELKPDNNTIQYPHWAKELDSSKLKIKADDYIEKIKQLANDATYITNKMPHNFLHLGIIQQLFPCAKIIHCTRNPKDTALSIFFHQFNKNHPYASNLGDLHFYYQQYKKLMEHWEHELSLQILAINYEELINNPEQKCRELIEFCNLDWDEKCLNFHNNKRLVNTPSYHQVRQPLYKNAINRHQHYLKHLTDFK